MFSSVNKYRELFENFQVTIENNFMLLILIGKNQYGLTLLMFTIDSDVFAWAP